MAMYTELYIDQGTDFVKAFDQIASDGTPIDVTGYRFESQIKKSYYSANVTANLVMTIVNAANGNVTMSLDAANTANIAAGRYLYDVKMITAANVTSRLVEGIVTINPQVTI